MAKSFITRFNWFINQFSRSEGRIYSKEEVLELLQALKREFEAFYKRDKVIQVVVEGGYKGQGSLELWRDVENDVRIREIVAERDNEGNILSTKEFNHIIPKENINKMKRIIQGLEVNQPYKCYYFAKKLGYSSWKELWKERGDYFERYYFPVKYWQKLGVIRYSGGYIIRIK
ncbi:MAG: hypothetical protein ACTSQG_09865 [Promethearchaeota archaeon]